MSDALVAPDALLAPNTWGPEIQEEVKRPVSKLGGTAKLTKLSPLVTRNGVNGVTSGEAWLPPLRSLRLAKRHTQKETTAEKEMSQCLKMMMRMMERIKTWEPWDS